MGEVGGSRQKPRGGRRDLARLVAQSILSAASSSAAPSGRDSGGAGERGAQSPEQGVVEQGGEQRPRLARGGLSEPAVGV